MEGRPFSSYLLNEAISAAAVSDAASERSESSAGCEDHAENRSKVSTVFLYFTSSAEASGGGRLADSNCLVGVDFVQLHRNYLCNIQLAVLCFAVSNLPGAFVVNIN